MNRSPTLADTLAANRKNGNVLSSAIRLFPPAELPSWASLRLTWHVRCLQLFFGLYLASLCLLLADLKGVSPFGVLEHKGFYLALAANYILLIGTAGAIQLRLYTAELEKYGATAIWVVGLLLNPLALGWLAPVYVLLAARDARRRTDAAQARRELAVA